MYLLDTRWVLGIVLGSKENEVMYRLLVYKA